MLLTNTIGGFVDAETAKKAAEKSQTLESVISREITTVEENVVLTDIFELVSDASIPIAVVDEKQRMKGIIVKGALIGALAGNDRYINAHEPAHEAVIQEVR